MDSMMGALGLGIVISLQDRVSASLENIRQKLISFSGVSEEMLKKFDAGVKQMLGGFASMTTGAKILGSVESFFGSSIKTAQNFEQAMAKVKAVSRATDEDFIKLSAQAKQLGRDTQFSATQAANSQELLARAGFQTDEIISSMPGLLDMAASEGMDLANAADIMSNTLRGFNLTADQSGKVANILASTSSLTNTSISTLGESFKYVASNASALGMSIEETAALIGVLGNAGRKGSMSGTDIRGMLSNLVTPSDKGAEALEKLGITIQDQTGNLRSFDDILQQFSTSMQGMSRIEKMKFFSEIFDKKAATGMIALLNQYESGAFSHVIGNLQAENERAKEMAETMNNTLQGSTFRLESASEGLRIAIGEQLVPAYIWINNKIAIFKSWMTKLIQDHPVLTKLVLGLVTALTTFVGTILIATGAIMTFSGLIKIWPMLRIAIITTMNSLRANVLSAKIALQGLGSPVFWLIGIAGLLYLAWQKNFAGIKNMVRAVSEGFKMACNASKDGIADVDDALASELQKLGIWDFAVNMGKVFFRVRQLWEGIVEGFLLGVNEIKGFLKSIYKSFEPLISNGKTFLNLLGLFSPIVETQSSKWKILGEKIGHVVPYILAVIGAFKGLSIATSIIKNISSVLGLVTAHPVIAAIVAIIAVIAYLYTHWDAFAKWFNEIIKGFANIFKGVFKAIEGICDIVIGALTLDWEKFSQGFKELWEGNAKFWAGIWKTIKAIFGNSIGKFAGIILGVVSAVKLWTAAQTLLNFALSANPIGLLIIAASALIAIGYQVYKNWDSIKKWWDSWTLKDIFAIIKNYVQNACDWCKGLWTSFINWLGSFEFPDVFAIVKNYAQNACDWCKELWTSLKNWFGAFEFPDVFATLKDWGTSAINFLKGLWDGFANRVDNTFNYLSTPEFEAQAKIVGTPEYNISVMDSTYMLPEIPKPKTSEVTQDIDLKQNIATKNNIDEEIKKVAVDSAYIKKKLQEQTQNITILNEMSEGFSQRVEEMDKAWTPFKKSLGESFSEIYLIMQNISDKIRYTVIPPVQQLALELRKVAEEISIIAKAGGLKVKVDLDSVPAPAPDIHAMDYLAPVPQQGVQNYESYRKTLENRGYVLNPDDTVKKLPPDLLMSDNFMQQQAINKAQEKLKALKMDITPANQEIIRTVNPISSPEFLSANMDIVPKIQPLPNITPANQEIIRTVTSDLPSVNAVNMDVIPKTVANTVKTPEQIMREAVINNTTNITNADNKIINGGGSLLAAPDIKPAMAIPKIDAPVININLPQNNLTDIRPIDLRNTGENTVNNIVNNSNPVQKIIEQNAMHTPNFSPVVQPVIPAPKATEVNNIGAVDISSIVRAFNTQPKNENNSGVLQNDNLFRVLGEINNKISLQKNQEQNQSSPYLIKHSENQSALNNIIMQNQPQKPEPPVNVNNQVDVKIESKPADVYLDGAKIGAVAFRWIEKQNLRQGISAF